MLVIPGAAAKNDCDGVTRRDLLRVGGSGVLGLSLGRLFAARRRRPPSERAGRRRPRLGQGQERHPGLPPGRAEPPRPVGPQGQRARQRARASSSRSTPSCPACKFTETAAEARAGERQDHDDPLDELHAERPVQPHGRHLPDDDRLHDRQGQPVGPARAAEPEGLPELRLEHHPAQAADRADAAVRDAAAAAAGEQRRRQGRHRRLPRQGVRPVHALSRPATTWTWPRWTASRSTT